MTPQHRLCQWIAILDEVARSREHLRRAVRALGHSPLVFESLEELHRARGTSQRYALLCLGVAGKARDAGVVVAQARGAVGANVPVTLFANAGPGMTSRMRTYLAEGEELASASTFAQTFVGLEAIIERRGMPVVKCGLTWGGYWFLPESETVRAHGIDIRLTSFEFELALELFHNIGRVVPKSRLCMIAEHHHPEVDIPAIDVSIALLRKRLGLMPLCGWRLTCVAHAGYQLSKLGCKQETGAGALVDLCMEN